ncbi:MAG: DNA adenine methylase [Fibrobacteria bacterium]
MIRRLTPLVQPFLKWAGGKRQLLPDIRNHLPDPKKYAGYYEPFIGGGAVLFDVQPKKAVINDVNGEIINAYKVIRDHTDELISALRKHKNEAEYFYQLREFDRQPAYAKSSPVDRAARILFLNKTCYNGLFRVNSRGQFNVPFGKYKNPNIVNEAGLKGVGEYLRDADITFRNGDFGAALAGIKKNAFVYFDPPYHPLSDTSSFTGYTLQGFGEEEQIRLKKLCDRLDRLGCKFLLSNSYCDFVRELYKGYKQIKLQASRNINSVGASRGKISEILVKNYE